MRVDRLDAVGAELEPLPVGRPPVAIGRAARVIVQILRKSPLFAGLRGRGTIMQLLSIL